MTSADEVYQNHSPQEKRIERGMPTSPSHPNGPGNRHTPQVVLLEALVSISRKVAEWSDERALFQSIVEDAQRALSADRVLIIHPQGNEQHLGVVAHSGFPPEQAWLIDEYKVRFADHPLVQRLFESREALAVADSHLLDPGVAALVRSYNFRAFYVAPLMYGGEFMGALGVIYTDSPHDWTQEETEWLTALADQAAVALTLRRTIQEQRRGIAVREALHTASRRLQSSPDIATVIEATLQGVAQVVPSVGASIHLLSDDGKTATVAGILGYSGLRFQGFESKDAVGYTYPADDSALNSRTLLEHEAFFLHDFQESVEKWSNAEMPTLRAWMSVPLIANNRCLGKVTVDHDLPGAYGPEELAIVQTFAAHAAVAIERARLYSETNDRAAQFASLARSARSLVSDLDLATVLQSVVDNARSLTGGEACMMLYEPERDTLAPCAFAWVAPWHEGAEDPSPSSLEVTMCSVALHEQKIIVMQDLLDEPLVRELKGLRVRSAVVLPLSVGDERLGVLKIAWTEPERVDEECVALCTAFADHAALAVHNARQHDEMVKREEERTMLLRQLLTAQENERKRIALELHDGPLQSLGVGLINADALRKKMEAGMSVTATDVNELRRYFAAVVDEIRGLMADLRPDVLDSYGLLAGLEAYCRRLKESIPFEIHILYDLRERLPTYMEVLIYRLVQEALNNVRKHANATQANILVHVDRGNGNVAVEVKDNGKGFDPGMLPHRREGFGLGIKSMLERTQSAGGTMLINSVPGKGTTVTFQIPLPA
jgi:signal transduction histidine kinase